MTAKKPELRVIKKYPNRRLYDTVTSAYITLADVKQLVVKSEPFRVVDAKSTEDLTRNILLQIILEEEAGGTPLFSEAVLAQMIRVYGNAMQGMMGTVLEKNMQAMAELQGKFAEQIAQFQALNPMAGAGLSGVGGIGSMGAQPGQLGIGGAAGAAFGPEAWAKLMQGSNPMMQGLMASYTEHSKTLFTQMQEQMQQQAKGMLKPFAGKR